MMFCRDSFCKFRTLMHVVRALENGHSIQHQSMPQLRANLLCQCCPDTAPNMPNIYTKQVPKVAPMPLTTKSEAMGVRVLFGLWFLCWSFSQVSRTVLRQPPQLYSESLQTVLGQKYYSWKGLEAIVSVGLLWGHPLKIGSM